MTVTLGEDAVLEYLPDETIPFAGSDFSQQTRVHMLSGAVLFAMDLLTPGRTARGECFAFTRYYSQRLQGVRWRAYLESWAGNARERSQA